MTTRTPASYRLTLTVGLCFLVALMEGLDLQRRYSRAAARRIGGRYAG